MKNIPELMGLSGVLDGGSLLVRAPWLVVLAAIVLPSAIKYGVILWLARPKRSRRVSCSLLIWEAPAEREDSDSKRKSR
jgi:hypothetical protein